MPEGVNKSSSVSPLHSPGGHNSRRCTVQLLDDVAIQVEFKKTDLGSSIFDQVCDHLNLAERDFFGLRFMDHNLHRYWLDQAKPIMKQVKSTESIVFAFRVKFYPADPSILKEEFTRYLLVLQLRRDLLHGRLHCPQSDLAHLAAYIIQAELGDYDPNEHVGNYVSQFKILINQSPRIEEKIAQLHKSLKGQKPSEVDGNFLKKAASLDTYGYYPYTIKDSKAGQVYMGATPKGVLIYQTSRKLHHLTWSDIDSMDYSGKEFYIYPQKSYFEQSHIEDVTYAVVNNNNNVSTNGSVQFDASRPTSGAISTAHASHATSTLHLQQHKENKKKPCLKFLCPSSTFSKQMWKYMLAQKAFFTSAKSDQVKPVVKRHLLFRNSTFRWHPNNRVLEELKEATTPKRPCPHYERLAIPRQADRSERSGPWANKFHTMPARNRNPVSDGVLNSHTIAAATSAEAPELGTSMPARPTIFRPPDDSLLLKSSILATSSSLMTSSGSPLAKTTIDVSTPMVSPIGSESMWSESSLPRLQISPLQNSAATTLPTHQTSTPKRPVDHTDGPAIDHKVTVTKTTLTYKNGSVKEEKITEELPTNIVQHRSEHICRSLARFLFLILLAAIVLSAILVFGMETKDPWINANLRQFPVIDDFRHNFYDPWRRFVCQKAQNYWKE